MPVPSGENGFRFTVDAGSVIFEAGDTEKCFYSLVSGKVIIYLGYGTNHGVAISEVEAGGFFGEMAIIDDRERSATAVATEDCELIRIECDSIDEIIRNHPTVAAKFMVALTRRLREAYYSYIGACKIVSELSGSARQHEEEFQQRVERYVNVYRSYEGLFNKREKRNFEESR